MLRSKAGKSQRWLANQVWDGMDTSDPDPANWKRFGELAELEAEAAAEPQEQTLVKAGPPKQSSPAK